MNPWALPPDRLVNAFHTWWRNKILNSKDGEQKWQQITAALTAVPASVQRRRSRVSAAVPAGDVRLPSRVPTLAPGAPPPLSGGDAAAFMAARG